MGTERDPELIRWRPWLWVGIAAGLVVLFLALFLAHEFRLVSGPSIDAPKLTGPTTALFIVLDAIGGAALSVIVIGIAWTAFVRQSGRERLLFILCLYVSGLELRPLVSDGLHASAHVTGSIYRYPDITAFYATIVYGGLVFAIDRSSMPDRPRRACGVVAFLAMIVGWVFPIWAGYAQVPEVLGSIAFAGVLFALGVALSQFAKIDIFAPTKPAVEV